MKKPIKTYGFLSAIVLFQILLIAYFGYRKEGLFIDELWTFNLSNGYFFPMVGDASNYYNRWLPGSFFHEALAAYKPFSFDSVFYNQAADVHPPLYYAIIHFICSLTIGEYSKWHGIVLNIFFFVLAQILLFELTKKITRDIRYALVVCFLYGFSVGAISTCVSIRMYMLLTLVAVLITYLHSLYLSLFFQAKKISCKSEYALILAIGTSYTIGLLVHYYFVIYAFFLSLFTLPILYLFSGWKSLFKYILSTVSGILLAVLIFPASLSHIIGSGYRGVEAFNNLHTTNLSDRVQSFLVFINDETGALTIIAVSLLLFFFTALFKCLNVCKLGQEAKIEVRIPIREIAFNLGAGLIVLIIIASATILSFILISKVAASITQRYVWYLQPFIVLIATCLSLSLLDRVLTKKYIATGFLILLFIAIIAPNIRTKNISWLYTIDKPVFELLSGSDQSFSKMIAIQSDKTWWPMMAEVKFFEKIESTFMTTFEDFKKVSFDDSSYLVFISHQANPSQTNEIFNHMNKHGFKNITAIYSEWHGNIYRVTKD